ncbi:hypothetical protein EJ08DRAFT_697582 [Tothia fuscella]|uniref:Uncharacterized protein n=1 Tax=Tothia fuscella TaxID=1048955 RepID=A0A9P4NRF2_9PEZI|nr:hypothetical protein EJ08DRAFT_697582 [Tothia fuscella]
MYREPTIFTKSKPRDQTTTNQSRPPSKAKAKPGGRVAELIASWDKPKQTRDSLPQRPSFRDSQQGSWRSSPPKNHNRAQTGVSAGLTANLDPQAYRRSGRGTSSESIASTTIVQRHTTEPVPVSYQIHDDPPSVLLDKGKSKMSSYHSSEEAQKEAPHHWSRSSTHQERDLSETPRNWERRSSQEHQRGQFYNRASLSASVSPVRIGTPDRPNPFRRRNSHGSELSVSVSPRRDSVSRKAFERVRSMGSMSPAPSPVRRDRTSTATVPLRESSDTIEAYIARRLTERWSPASTVPTLSRTGTAVHVPPPTPFPGRHVDAPFVLDVLRTIDHILTDHTSVLKAVIAQSEELLHEKEHDCQLESCNPVHSPQPRPSISKVLSNPPLSSTSSSPVRPKETWSQHGAEIPPQPSPHSTPSLKLGRARMQSISRSSIRPEESTSQHGAEFTPTPTPSPRLTPPPKLDRARTQSISSVPIRPEELFSQHGAEETSRTTSRYTASPKLDRARTQSISSLSIHSEGSLSQHSAEFSPTPSPRLTPPPKLDRARTQLIPELINLVDDTHRSFAANFSPHEQDDLPPMSEMGASRRNTMFQPPTLPKKTTASRCTEDLGSRSPKRRRTTGGSPIAISPPRIRVPASQQPLQSQTSDTLQNQDESLPLPELSRTSTDSFSHNSIIRASPKAQTLARQQYITLVQDTNTSRSTLSGTEVRPQTFGLATTTSDYIRSNPSPSLIEYDRDAALADRASFSLDSSTPFSAREQRRRSVADPLPMVMSPEIETPLEVETPLGVELPGSFPFSPVEEKSESPFHLHGLSHRSHDTSMPTAPDPVSSRPKSTRSITFVEPDPIVRQPTSKESKAMKGATGNFKTKRPDITGEVRQLWEPATQGRVNTARGFWGRKESKIDVSAVGGVGGGVGKGDGGSGKVRRSGSWWRKKGESGKGSSGSGSGSGGAEGVEEVSTWNGSYKSND